MMEPGQEAQAALFYEFSLEEHVPHDHLLRSIDRFVDLTSTRAHLAELYSHTGCPSVDPELLRHLIETTVACCIEEGLVSGQRMAVDTSLIEADANKQFSASKDEWDAGRIDVEAAPRAVKEYLDTRAEADFGAATCMQPEFTSHPDPPVNGPQRAKDLHSLPIPTTTSSIPIRVSSLMSKSPARSDRPR